MLISVCPSAEAVAVDHREDRLRGPVDRVVQRPVLVHSPLLHRGATPEFVDVGPRGEGFVAGTGEDDRPCVLVGFELAERADHFRLQHHRHRVELVRAIQRHHSGRSATGHEDRLVLHGDRRGNVAGRLEASPLVNLD